MILKLRVKVTDDIFNNSKQIDLPKQYVKDMNLTDIFGVMFKSENIAFGKLEKEIYEDGYKIHLNNTIFESKIPIEEIKGPIEDVGIFFHSKENNVQLTLRYENNHTHYGNITFFIEQERINDMSIYQSDRTKISGQSNKYYWFNKEKNIFKDYDSEKFFSQQNSQEYIDLANYFLKLMKNDETKELWEQTQKERELKKSKQDSLQINFPKN